MTEADPELTSLFLEALPSGVFQFDPGLLRLDRIKRPESVCALCVTVRSPVSEAQMESLPALELIVTMSAGYDHIDMAAANRLGIKVCNVPEYGPAVAEFNMALILALTRNLRDAFDQTRRGEFDVWNLVGVNLQGRTLGIIGLGRIGRQIARLASGFGMNCVAYDPQSGPTGRDTPATLVTLDSLLERSDVICLCCPLTDSTVGLFSHREFGLMKRGVKIVNTSRGAVIDTDALLKALDSGIVSRVALDVFEAEARSTTGTSLADHPKVLVTPHIAYLTCDSLTSIKKSTVRLVCDYFDGRPLPALNSVR